MAALRSGIVEEEPGDVKEVAGDEAGGDVE